MEDNTNNALFTFVSPKNQSSYIKVIGVGGGGGNAVNHMYRQGIKGVDFIVCNTDMKALNDSPVPNKIILGDLGLGAGNKPERASKAAESKADEIREAISHNTQMLFITAGMGGGTGTGAAPVVAQIAKDIELDNEDAKHVLVVAIVTKPFSFEGKRRRDQAEAGIRELRKHVDAIIVINNDKLRSYGDLDITEAFGMADDVLLTAAKGIAEIITGEGHVNIDFMDVNTVMENSGTALMGTGTGKGENRAHDAIEQATTSVLLDDSDIRGAKNVLLYFSYHPDHKIKMDEIGEITDFLSDKTDGTADVIWGAGTDDTLGDELKVTLIATGFEKKSTEPLLPNVTTLQVEPRNDESKPTPQPVDEDGMTLIQKPVEEPVSETPAEPQATADKSVERNVFQLEDVVDETPSKIAPEPVADQLLDIQVVSQQSAPAAEIEKPVIEFEQPVVEVAKPAVEAASQEPAPIQQAAPAPAPAPQPAAAERSMLKDFHLRDAAERIRRMHELLRNDPNGAELVENMSTSQLADDEIFVGAHSSASEASSMTMRADGSFVSRSNPFSNPD